MLTGQDAVDALLEMTTGSNEVQVQAAANNPPVQEISVAAPENVTPITEPANVATVPSENNTKIIGLAGIALVLAGVYWVTKKK